MNVVIVEDQKDLSALICQQLEKAGIHVSPAYTGEEAFEVIDPELHDVLILDRGLPDMDGLDVLKSLRQDGFKMPVLILTAMDELGDKISGLNSGADDYLVKPFEMEELIARLHALYRRPSETINVKLEYGNLVFSPVDNELRINDEAVQLTIKEKDALERLLRLPERVVGKDTLQSMLYGYGEEGSQNSVEVVIHRLRKKLKDAQCNLEIKTLRGIGYLIREKD